MLVSFGTFKNHGLPFSFAFYIGSFTNYTTKEGGMGAVQPVVT